MKIITGDPLDQSLGDIQGKYTHILAVSRCLKITEKVSFNIASEAQYVYKFGEYLKKNEACGHTVLPDRSVLVGQKIGGKCQN